MVTQKTWWQKGYVPGCNPGDVGSKPTQVSKTVIMLELKKEVVKGINNGSITKTGLARIILGEYPATEIAESLAEIILEKKEPSPIVLEQEAYDRVVSLFRVRGQRIVEGKVINETRGRKKQEPLCL